MDIHLRKIQLIIHECSVKNFSEILTHIDKAKADVINCEYLNDFSVFLVELSGTYASISRLESLLTTHPSNYSYHIQNCNQEQSTAGLEYVIECKTIGSRDGFITLVNWLNSFKAIIKHCQYVDESADKIHFQITFINHGEISISEMKHQFYDICDQWELDGFIECA